MPSPTYASRAGLFGWIMFDWAAQPIFLLVQTFFFGPYFVAHFLNDPVKGQTYWGWAIAASGLIVALGGPTLGAIADYSGRRKVWIAFFSSLLILGAATLWYAVPGDESRILLIMGAVILSFVGVEFATVFTNAMLPNLVPLNRVGRLSGIGWSAGYAGGLVALVAFLALFLPGSESDKTLLGLDPLIALDQSQFEADRLTGPIASIWYAVFVLPFFVLTKDLQTRKPMPFLKAVHEGIGDLKVTLTHVRRNALVFRFLLARMLYADGLAAIFAFGGIYGASTFGWGANELGVFAILLTIAGLAGTVLGGYADDRFGPRSVILVCLIGLIVSAGFVLSIDREHIAWFIAAESPVVAGQAFAGSSERAFLVAAAGIGLVAGPLQSASRSMMARLTPPEKSSEFFGLYAFSGKATAFAAPTLVTLATIATGSQRLGMATISIFLIAGFVLMVTMKTPNDRRSGAAPLSDSAP